MVFLQVMKSCLAIILFLVSSAGSAIDTAHRLTWEQWSVSRTAESILSMPALSRAIQDYQAMPNAKLLIRYPGGDRGNRWAQELQNWLISLGVPSIDLEMIPGSANVDIIELEIEPGEQQTAPVMTLFPKELPGNE